MEYIAFFPVDPKARDLGESVDQFGEGFDPVEGVVGQDGIVSIGPNGGPG